MFYSSDKSQIKTSTKAVLEEDGGTAAVQTSLRDDSHPVAQQICLIHVMGRHNDRAPCNTGKKWTLPLRNTEGGKECFFVLSHHIEYTTDVLHYMAVLFEQTEVVFLL